MISNVASWDRKYCNLAEFVKNKYKREDILESLGLELYKVGIDHQKKFLSDEQLNIYRNLLLEAHAESVCYDSDFSYQDEIDKFEWTKIKNKEISNSENVVKFNKHLYDVWEKEKSKFIDESFAMNVKEESNRKKIIKKFFTSKSKFRFAGNLSRHGVLVFTKPINNNLRIAISIDAPTLKRPAGVSDDFASSFNIRIELYESIGDGNNIRHFNIGFDILYPIAEGIAFRSYAAIKTNTDLLALLEIYILLFQSVEHDLVEAIELDFLI